jgi:hypothetical protein
MPVIQQLIFAHMLILEGAALRVVPAAKLIGRDPDGRVGEFLLVQPLQRISVGSLLHFKLVPLSVLTPEHIICHGRLLYGPGRRVRWVGARACPDTSGL